MPNIKLVIQYNGSGFSGFELQPGKRTIRGELEKALHKLFKARIKVISSSRTDSGVHALGNAVNFKAKNSIPVLRVPRALNSILPEDIRVNNAEVAAKSFSSRYDAKSKTYEYYVYNGETLPPFFYDYVWHVKQRLSLSAMRTAARYLAGKHDFSSFCASRSDDKDFVKEIYKLKITRKALGIWGEGKAEVLSFRITGSGFLYKMVRNIVGSLVAVGIGKHPAGWVKKVLNAKDRKKAGRTAPAQGLCLIEARF